MKLKDAKQIVKLLNDEWDLGKTSSKAKGNVCAWIYFCEIMEESEKIVLEKKDNKVIGICGYNKYNSKKHIFRKKFYGALKNILINSNSIKNKQAMLKYLNDYDYTPKKLQNYFDGDLSIIIVDKKYRNLGIGKKMIFKIFDYAKKDNIKNLQILSDQSCNYRFYENVGCKKIYKKVIPCGEPTKCNNALFEEAYIYEKKFN